MGLLRACLNEVRGRSGNRDGVCSSFRSQTVGPLQARSPRAHIPDTPGNRALSISTRPAVSVHRRYRIDDAEA